MLSQPARHWTSQLFDTASQLAHFPATHTERGPHSRSPEQGRGGGGQASAGTQPPSRGSKCASPPAEASVPMSLDVSKTCAGFVHPTAAKSSKDASGRTLDMAFPAGRTAKAAKRLTERTPTRQEYTDRVSRSSRLAAP